jgi:predicted nucleic acid-binding protein
VLYVDSSALLKLLWPEPESPAVAARVEREDIVVVSSLTELEVEARLVAARMAGRYGDRAWRRLRARLTEFRATDPFRFRTLPGSVFETALDQLPRAVDRHCRALDRLHLAAMTELGVERLLTSDVAQGAAAHALGFDVIVPT